ncbi:hypothetical protein [Bacillus wiedmannii]|uniref:hypothetical protein n=1 Tax=Bacillus wiedmannii TaxID=1890302 RepID=UPI0006DA17E8|nr:hypothetical protein [Bacillus wiedmannii]KPU55830.1 hypothetical protein AN402_3679 [Bacillus wiedmannii]
MTQNLSEKIFDEPIPEASSITYLGHDGKPTTLDTYAVDDLSHFVEGKKTWEKTLVSVDVPEVKQEFCDKKIKTPFGNIVITVPCGLFRRVTTHSLVARVHYPEDMAGELIQSISECALNAAIAAAATGAVIAATTPPAMPGAIPAAYEVFKEVFVSCMKSEVLEMVDYSIDYDKVTGEWSQIS